ncbi:MAG: hypothetical protein CML01_11380 [Pseudomonas sp.]|nr:hypothetical protein [Pseudomonas sp.]|tara:strand:- start:23415 stop:23681 length:267 start_codon:yes stop_codon:yes gene_type:complete
MTNEQMPWKIGAMESGRVAIDDAQDRQVTGWLEPEDAERILKAVNAHDDLLAALKGMLQAYDDGVQSDWALPYVRAAHAAIAKARGEA